MFVSHWSAESNFLKICHPTGSTGLKLSLMEYCHQTESLIWNKYKLRGFKWLLLFGAAQTSGGGVPPGKAWWFNQVCQGPGVQATLSYPFTHRYVPATSGKGCREESGASKTFPKRENSRVIYKCNNLQIRGSNVTFKIHLVLPTG